MIMLAKTLHDDADMIKLAQIFVQQPRLTVCPLHNCRAAQTLTLFMQLHSQATLYCQEAPKSLELNGLFQCQYESVDQRMFIGDVPLGSTGTIPFGLSAPLFALGSCHAHPSGPIPDGSQLADIISEPGLESLPNYRNSHSPAPFSTTTLASAEVLSTTVEAAVIPDSIERGINQYFGILHYFLLRCVGLYLFVCYMIRVIKGNDRELRQRDANRAGD